MTQAQMPKFLAFAIALMAMLLCRSGPTFVASPPGHGVALPAARSLAGATAQPIVVPESGRTGCSLLLGSVLLLGLGRAAAQRSSRVARKANLVATRPDQAIPWWDRMSKWRHECGVGIWAEKFKHTYLFTQEGGNVKKQTCTILVIKRGGNMVTDKHWPEKHGHYGVEVGYERFIPQDWEMKSTRRIEISKLQKNECPPLRKLKQFFVRPKDWIKYEIGQKIWPSDLFKVGDLVDVHGKSQEKGMLGVMARWRFKGGPATHGSKHHRRYGAVGAGNGRVLPRKRMAGWKGGNVHINCRRKILQVIDRIDEDNMPESIIVVEGIITGYPIKGERGGSYVYLTHSRNTNDGRYEVDPVYMWYFRKGEGSDPFIPLQHYTWAHTTFWGRDVRWIAQEKKKYWPDGYPGYDNRFDPFHDDCDPHLALKVPEW